MYKKKNRRSFMTIPIINGKPVDTDWLKAVKNSLDEGHYVRLRGRIPIKGEHYRNSYGSTTGCYRELPLKHAQEADCYVAVDYRRV